MLNFESKANFESYEHIVNRCTICDAIMEYFYSVKKYFCANCGIIEDNNIDEKTRLMYNIYGKNFTDQIEDKDEFFNNTIGVLGVKLQ